MISRNESYVGALLWVKALDVSLRQFFSAIGLQGEGGRASLSSPGNLGIGNILSYSAFCLVGKGTEYEEEASVGGCM